MKCFFFLILLNFPQFLFSQTRDSILSISIAGDLMIDRGVRKYVEKKGNASSLFTNVDSLFKSTHFSVVNLETAVTDSGKKVPKYFNFKMNPVWLKDLKSAGITHVDVANNHSFDYGLKGFEQTIDHLKESNLILFGTRNDYRKPINIEYIDTLNQKIAIISASTFGLGIKVQKKDTLIPAVSSIYALNKEIRTFKKEFPEITLIVMLHWGIEYEKIPSEKQQNLAKSIIDSGADMIIGHHPHILQMIDYYKGKPIFYSIGNFIFDQREATTKESMLVQLLFKKGKLNQFRLFPLRIKNFAPVPVSLKESPFMIPILKNSEKKMAKRNGYYEISID